MPAVPITLAGGRRITFEIEAGGPGPHFLLGVRKSGSTVLNSICQALCEMADRRFVRVGETFFDANVVAVDWSNDPAVRGLVHPGNVYGGFREMPVALRGLPMFERAPKLLMVRDPRDALISEYFSNAYSHSVPAAQDGADAVAAQILALRQQALAQDIGDWVLRAAGSMNHTMMQFAPLLGQDRTLVVKYEEVIFDKAGLIGHLSRQFGLAPTAAQVGEILAWADLRPEVENPRSFVRKVSPGDHTEKLDRGTIEVLNRQLAPAMALFGYAE
jgi:hypothetical protein